MPQGEVINAVKSSTAREYNVKYDELLTIKEFCQDLITDIIGSVYISNNNKVKYINILNKYLKENNNLREYEIKQIEENIVTNNKMKNFHLDIFPMIAGIVTSMGIFFLILNITEFDFDNFLGIYIGYFISVFLIGVLLIFISFIINNKNK